MLDMPLDQQEESPPIHRPSRMLRVSGIDGKKTEVEVLSRDSIGVIKSRISAALGVHQDLQELFDSEAPLDDDYELPDEKKELTLLHKTPDLHKVTPGPPLNCRVHARKKSKVVATFRSGDVLKVIGSPIPGGRYGDDPNDMEGKTGHSQWVPVLVEVSVEDNSRSRNRNTQHPFDDNVPQLAEGAEGADESDRTKQHAKIELVKAWCACGSNDDRYVVPLTEKEQHDYYSHQHHFRA